VGRVGRLADPVEPALVALGHAFVLAEVLVPGRDDELLEDPARVTGRSQAAIRARRSDGKMLLGMTVCTAFGGVEV
jgi:hypothetical protein